MHRYVLYNEEVREAGDKLLSPGQVGLLSGWGVFSTIRVHKGVLFAFERHFARMRKDAVQLRVPFPTRQEELHDRLMRLVQANQATEASLRVVVVRNRGGMWEGPGERDYDVIALTTDVNRWGDGVRLGIVPHARHSDYLFAGAKILSWAQNLCWYEEAHEAGLDEVVLLNERDEVTECTSANLFVVSGTRVLTPPLTSGCLPGVTRDIVLHDLRVPGIEVGENTLLLADLEAADEIFITSTTRNLLPVLSIEGLTLRNQGSGVRQKLNDAFSEYVKGYVDTHAAPQLAGR